MELATRVLVSVMILTGSGWFFEAGAQQPVSYSEKGDVTQRSVDENFEPAFPFRHVKDELLVRFKQEVHSGQIGASHARTGATTIRKYRRIHNLFRVVLPRGRSMQKAIEAYHKDPNVLYAEPNYLVHALNMPNDPRFSELWGMNNTGQNNGKAGSDIDAAKAWDLQTGSKDVVVAVIDTGIDYSHQDLADNIYRNVADCNGNGIDDDGNGYIDDCHGIDAVNNDSDPMDDHYHGTHVAGTIGAAGNNALGVVGVNWHVGIIGCKFLGADGSGTTADAVECLDYVSGLKDKGVNIVATNNSWGGGGYSRALLDAIEAQRDRGILFIAAAGNDGMNNDNMLTYPCSYEADNIICVANSDRNDLIHYSSNYGKSTVHLAAPGTEILSTVPAGGYSVLSGTSMATPHVTGTAALLFAQNPQQSRRDVKNRIVAGGDVIAGNGKDTITGRRLNAFGALTCNNSVVLSRLKPLGKSFTSAIGQTITLSALHINCATPNGPVTVTIQPSNETVQLLDDGAAPDRTAGDGVYTGSWTPSEAGTFTLNFPNSDIVTVEIDPFLQPGFPVKTFHGSGSYHGGPSIHTLVGNIDDDPRLEIVTTALSTGPLYAWHSDGSQVAGWPVSDEFGAAYPAMGSLYGSTGALEIFSGYFSGWLSAYLQDGMHVAGWPRRSANYITSPPALADVDKDGLDEIFLGEEDWKLHGYLASGSIFTGWPVFGNGGQERHTPAIADLDGDGSLEIVSVSGRTSPGVYLHANHYDGSIVAGFPVLLQVSGVDFFPVIGDVDGDGQPEIVLAAGNSTYILAANGTIKRSMTPVGSINYSTAPALADLDGDGIPEIIEQTNTALNVWRGDGSVYPGWPVDLGDRWQGNSSPVVGDVDGDQLPDIVITTQAPGSGATGDVRIYDRSGRLHSGFPKALNIGSGAVPAIADIDLDGHNEVIITGDYWDGKSGYYDKVWAYDLGGAAHGAIHWGQFMGGPKHQGFYSSSGCITDRDSDSDTDGSDLYLLAAGFRGSCLSEFAAAFGR